MNICGNADWSVLNAVCIMLLLPVECIQKPDGQGIIVYTLNMLILLQNVAKYHIDYVGVSKGMCVDLQIKMREIWSLPSSQEPNISWKSEWWGSVFV